MKVVPSSSILLFSSWSNGLCGWLFVSVGLFLLIGVVVGLMGCNLPIADEFGYILNGCCCLSRVKCCFLCASWGGFLNVIFQFLFSCLISSSNVLFFNVIFQFLFRCLISSNVMLNFFFNVIFQFLFFVYAKSHSTVMR